MALRDANGNVITQSVFDATDTTSAPIPQYKVNAPIYEDYDIPGAKNPGRRLKFYEGQIITQADMDNAFAEATITSIAPATGAVAGGDAVTITGTNFSNATAAALGGVALTAFTVVSDTEITGITGAHAAGAVDVTVTDDSGTATLTGGFTYV